MASTSSEERDKLVAELRRLHESMRPPRMRAGDDLMELDLTIPQLKVMFLLLDLAPAPMSVIAGEMGISLSACTNLIDKLVSAGNVERGADPNDRRVVLCSLTHSGNESLSKLRQQSLFGQDEFVDRLSVEELKIMIEATTILQRVIAEINS